MGCIDILYTVYSITSLSLDFYPKKAGVGVFWSMGLICWWSQTLWNLLPGGKLFSSFLRESLPADHHEIHARKCRIMSLSSPVLSDSLLLALSFASRLSNHPSVLAEDISPKPCLDLPEKWRLPLQNLQYLFGVVQFTIQHQRCITASHVGSWPRQDLPFCPYRTWSLSLGRPPLTEVFLYTCLNFGGVFPSRHPGKDIEKSPVNPDWGRG